MSRLSDRWGRIRARFKKKQRTPELIPVEAERPDTPPGEADGGNWISRLRPGTDRDRQLAALRAGYDEMVGTVRAIRGHLERSEEVQGRLVGTLDGLNGTLRRLDEAQRHTVEIMSDFTVRAERRMAWLVGIFCTFVLLGLGAGAFVVWRGLPAAPPPAAGPAAGQAVGAESIAVPAPEGEPASGRAEPAAYPPDEVMEEIVDPPAEAPPDGATEAAAEMAPPGPADVDAPPAAPR